MQISVRNEKKCGKNILKIPKNREKISKIIKIHLNNLLIFQEFLDNFFLFISIFYENAFRKFTLNRIKYF